MIPEGECTPQAGSQCCQLVWSQRDFGEGDGVSGSPGLREGLNEASVDTDQ